MSQRKLFVGYDLREDVSQICCYSYKSNEPISISERAGEEDRCLIPTVLCRNKNTGQWLFGNEAITCAEAQEGILIDSILTKAQKGEEIELFHSKYTGITLLEKFLRKSLLLIKNHFPTEPITKIVVTIQEMEPTLVASIYQVLRMLGIEQDRASILGHSTSYLYYALNQDKSLWMNDVGLFDFNESGLYYYQLKINRRTRPMIADITKKEFTEILHYEMLENQERDIQYAFENIVNTALYKQIITTLYFTGKGFQGDWVEDSIKKTCTGRRAFLGDSLYGKGACYAAKEIAGEKSLTDFILLTEDMITTSVSIQVYTDTKIREAVLTEAAIPWNEVNGTMEIILDQEQDILIYLTCITTKEVERHTISIPNLPDRPNRTTRLGLNIICNDQNTAILKIEDLGFGDIYPRSGLSWEYWIDFIGNEVKRHG